MIAVYLGNWHPGEVQIADELLDLLRNVLCIPGLVPHYGLVVHYDSYGTKVLDVKV
jgi:hypothetical protein